MYWGGSLFLSPLLLVLLIAEGGKYLSCGLGAKTNSLSGCWNWDEMGALVGDIRKQISATPVHQVNAFTSPDASASDLPYPTLNRDWPHYIHSDSL